MSRSPFPSLRVEGGILPGDLFTRLVDDDTLIGREPASYNLAPHESVREAASRAFEYLTGAWTAFARERDKAIQQGRTLGALTRDRWLSTVFRALDYGILAATPTGGITVEDKQFPVTHRWAQSPVHLLGWDTDLDHRTKGVAGAASAAPQSMVQELLNRADEYLWGIVSNGHKLRLLRDSRALAGSAYVEFDLDMMFEERVFRDFVLFYRLLHASRLAVPAGETPQQCWLERWRTTAIAQGERARDRLEAGVREAVAALGTGFLRHPANATLRDQLTTGSLSTEDYRHAILRLVYRLLFWFVTEDRDVLLNPKAPPAAVARYRRFFSAERLRARALHGGGHHDDLWDSVRIVFTALGTEQGQPELALPGIGGLFERITRKEKDNSPLDPSQPDALDAPLEGLRLTNEGLLAAVRALAVIETGGQRRPVDFQHLDSEELGSVYERILELHPDHDPGQRAFALKAAAGSDRKTTGSYYTPSSLVEALLDSTLDSLLDEAATAPDDPVEALLSITVCDPACGSGHFLVAAARRIARRVAQLRSGEDEPSPNLVRTAMREVVSRCIHGVDVNPMAAELAKVSLWFESVEPGKPLAFLDANIRVGNSLLGTTPALVAQGIPDSAFKPITGDDPRAARTLADENKASRDQQGSLFEMDEIQTSNLELAKHTTEVVSVVAADLSDVYVQGRRLRQVDKQRLPAKRVADAWCAAFVQEKSESVFLSRTAVVDSTLDWIAESPTDLIRQQIADIVDDLDRDYRFFHWHIEFPHIFHVPDGGTTNTTGWEGGFTCVLGNPPWERIKLQEQEFFAARDEKITKAKNAAVRKKMIADLASSDEPADRALHADFTAELRRSDGLSHLLRNSGRYPLTGRGDINTYAVFAETGRTVMGGQGRVGMVLPTGIATDATTQYFFKDLVTTRTLASLYDFENEEKIFPSVDHRVRFCLWTGLGQQAPQNQINLAFRLRQTNQIHDRRFVLTPEDITLLNPNTGTCPVFDYKRNAEITLAIYRHVKTVLWREEPEDNPWGLSFLAMFHMANDSGIFRDRDSLEAEGWQLDGNIFTRGDDRMLPLYEAKMVHHYDHRFGTYDGQTQAQANVGTLPRSSPEQKDDAAYTTLPRYWVADAEVTKRLDQKGWSRNWFLGWRDICRSSDERTLISAAIPRTATPDGTLLMLPEHSFAACLFANLCSIVVDYISRQKTSGTHLKYYSIKQLPVLQPAIYEAGCYLSTGESMSTWIVTRALELAYTSYDMIDFAHDNGDTGEPFRWDEERRFWLRAELDAAYFHLYGVNRDDVDYIMDTFRAFRNNDPERFARTKKAILDIYDAMSEAIRSGAPYQTVLDPPPGHGPRHPARSATEK
jgi:hypothetical protein